MKNKFSTLPQHCCYCKKPWYYVDFIACTNLASRASVYTLCKFCLQNRSDFHPFTNFASRANGYPNLKNQIFAPLFLPLVGDNPNPRNWNIFSKLFQAALLRSLWFYKKLKSLFYQKNNCSSDEIIVLTNFFVKDSVGHKLIVNKKFTIKFLVFSVSCNAAQGSPCLMESAEQCSENFEKIAMAPKRCIIAHFYKVWVIKSLLITIKTLI